jgi:hypothetical protein
VADRSDDSSLELGILESEMKRLEAEYNMFFAGRLPRPPWETRARVAKLVKRLDRKQSLNNYADRFRFNTLQTRYSTFTDLWDRGLRAREEGRPGPFVQSRAAAPVASAPKAKDRILYVTTLSDPVRDMAKVQDLYETLAEARRESGHEGPPVPFHKFVDLVRTQMGTLKAAGSEEVAFRVAVKDGKVAFTARAMGGGAKSEE